MFAQFFVLFPWKSADGASSAENIVCLDIWLRVSTKCYKVQEKSRFAIFAMDALPNNFVTTHPAYLYTKCCYMKSCSIFREFFNWCIRGFRARLKLPKLVIFHWNSVLLHSSSGVLQLHQIRTEVHDLWAGSSPFILVQQSSFWAKIKPLLGVFGYLCFLWFSRIDRNLICENVEFPRNVAVFQSNDFAIFVKISELTFPGQSVNFGGINSLRWVRKIARIFLVLFPVLIGIAGPNLLGLSFAR